jgi:hypothetical protein
VTGHDAHDLVARDLQPMEINVTFRSALLATVAATGIAGFPGLATADNDELKCTSAAQSSWMGEDATRDLLKQQGYQEVRKIKVTEGNCYEVYGIDARGEQVEVYLDPTNGNLVAKED